MNLTTLSKLPDDLGGPLGPPIRKPEPGQSPVRRPDGIVIAPDGTMSTDFPLPQGMAPSMPPHTPAPAAPASPPISSPLLKVEKRPLAKGDKVRWVETGNVYECDGVTADSFSVLYGGESHKYPLSILGRNVERIA